MMRKKVNGKASKFRIVMAVAGMVFSMLFAGQSIVTSVNAEEVDFVGNEDLEVSEDDTGNSSALMKGRRKLFPVDIRK